MTHTVHILESVNTLCGIQRGGVMPDPNDYVASYNGYMMREFWNIDYKICPECKSKLWALELQEL